MVTAMIKNPAAPPVPARLHPMLRKPQATSLAAGLAAAGLAVVDAGNPFVWGMLLAGLHVGLAVLPARRPDTGRDAATGQKQMPLPADAQDNLPSTYSGTVCGLIRDGGWLADPLGRCRSGGFLFAAHRETTTLLVLCRPDHRPVTAEDMTLLAGHQRQHKTPLALVFAHGGYDENAQSAACATGILLFHHADLACFGLLAGLRAPPHGRRRTACALSRN